MFASLTDSVGAKQSNDSSTQKQEVQCDEEHAKYSECSANLTATQQNRIWRRVDLRLIPIITIMYLLAFMDRGRRSRRNDMDAFISCLSSGNIGATAGIFSLLIFRIIPLGNAKLDGLSTQLRLTGDKYNIALVSETVDTRLKRLLRHSCTDSVHGRKFPSQP